MTIERQARVFTIGGSNTGIKVTINLNLEQPNDRENWFKLPTYFMILEGVIKVIGKTKVVGNQIYFGNLPIPNAQLVGPATKNLFKVEDFGGCFPKFGIYVRKGSLLQLRLDQVYAKQSAGTILGRPDAYVVRFKL